MLMERSSRVACFVLLALLLTAAAADSVAADDRLRPAVHLLTASDRMFQLAAQGGYESAVQLLPWRDVEPTDGEWHWQQPDFAVRAAEYYDLGLIVRLDHPPDWAVRSPENGEGGPIDPDAYADFVATVARRYRGQVQAYIVWNEPNLRREWNGNPLNGADYMRYFDAAYHAIRAAPGGEGITVVTAGLAPTGINDGVSAVDDRVYLRQMYQAGLANPAYQNIAIGIHPYSAWNAPDAHWCGQAQCSDRGYDNHPSFFFANTIEDYHNIMVEFGDTTRQMWPTEFGWGTYDGLHYSDGTPAQSPEGFPYYDYIDAWDMANYVMRAYEIGQTTPWIGVMFLWNLNFADPYYVDNRDPRAAYAVWGTAPQPERPVFRLLALAPKTHTSYPLPE